MILTTFYLYITQLTIHGEVLKVHGTGCRNSKSKMISRELIQYSFIIMILPNASRDGTGMVYSNELIGSGGYVEVRLLFIYKKRIRYPNVFDEF